jgi:6-pyruvoyltetrahydropterin/6-carboxytetrahydropterin synthase
MPWDIIVKMDFNAAHYLKEYNGKCERLHGHTYKIIVHIAADKLNKVGIGYDFNELKKFLKKKLPDHVCLNEVCKFNPTTENLAYYFYQIIKKKYPVKKIEVWETETQGASYEEVK